jgi:hypothetical protein
MGFEVKVHPLSSASNRSGGSKYSQSSYHIALDVTKLSVHSYSLLAMAMRRLENIVLHYRRNVERKLLTKEDSDGT